ncbi:MULTISPECIES: glycosyltransferase [unclassified Methanosarcina]|uniref:glycosyltransferase n=1 Tax=unclassified Methanosarcina TaxID=2644672 RepID=UPI0006223786|nr:MULTISPECIES: glycosyltransferase [unclassified Methanosarcina]KKG07354.1 glycosyl transferase family 1 [Methanosarcina sp. 2.H.A.1B.4]KKH47420.1 glycosyl transferase family 1 [Methanosarcina sp. 1.H.A.2.2]
MKILVIPTTDWIRHPFPNRLNFIFDILAEKHEVYVLHFNLENFRNNRPRKTACKLVDTKFIDVGDPSLYYLLNWPEHLLEMRKVIKKEGIDVVLSANILPSFIINFLNVPVVFDYLDHLEESASIYYPDSFFGKIVKNGVRQITRYNLRHATSVITVTRELKNFLEGIRVKNIEVIPNGVNCNLLRPLPKEEAKKELGLKGAVIGYVGSLEHWVDLEMVVESLPDLEVSLLVVGPGLFTDYGDKIKELANKLGVSEKITFTGAVPYEDLGPYISAMDIGLNTLKKMDKNEYAAGGKVFNYLACGRPVLSSRTISLVRMLGDDLYYYDDKDGFIREVKRILETPTNEDRYREIAKTFDWEVLARKYEEVLRKSI